MNVFVDVIEEGEEDAAEHHGDASPNPSSEGAPVAH